MRIVSRRLLLPVLALVALAACVIIETAPIPAPRAATIRYAAPGGTAAATGCLSTSGPYCSPKTVLLAMDCSQGDTLILKDGTYRGTDYMLDLWSWVTGKSGSDAAHRCTIRAENDGGAFIDGEMVRTPFQTNANHWWVFQGFDSGHGVATSTQSTNIIYRTNFSQFKRLCFSNSQKDTTDHNAHVWMVWNSQDNLFEDICAFGWGRNTLMPYNDDPAIPTLRNTYRRLWLRFEGYAASAGAAGPLQAEYYQYGDPSSPTGSNPTSGDDLYENVITVFTAEQGGPLDSIPGYMRRWSSRPVKKVGFVMYGNSSYDPDPNCASMGWCLQMFRDTGASPNGNFTTNAVDIFADARWAPQLGTFAMECSGSAKCADNTADRLTGIRNTTAPVAILSFPTTTNAKECTTLAACPNFYTGAAGSSGGIGARNCFEYTNGVLGTTTATQGLWPWRMDKRIKDALTRERNAGLGGSLLAGSAGTGYEANTVTSEIVSRYGAIPTQCSRAATGTTPNPPAGLNLTELWRAIWTPLAGIKA